MIVRALIALIFLLGAVASARAAAPKSLKVVRLTLHPAPTTRPALKHRLLPDAFEVRPGNAAGPYYLAVAAWKQDEAWEKFSQTWADARAASGGQDAFPLAEARRLTLPVGALRLLDAGARRGRAEWGHTIREHGVEALLPHLNELRQLATPLAVRARLAIADGRFDDAVHDLTTGFALARHLNEDAVLVQQLVAAVITGQMLDATQAMIEARGSPNLYWPLASLPRPYHDVRDAMAWERSFLLFVLPGLRNGEGGDGDDFAAISEEESRRGFRRLGLAMAIAGDGGSGFDRHPAWSALAVVRLYPDAKRFLVERGADAAALDARPPQQVITEYLVRSYREAADEIYKWQALPYAVARAGSNRAMARFREEVRRGSTSIFLTMLPAIQSVRFRTALVDRRIDLLQTIEALRAHAATHGGQLPATLEEMAEETPVPVDVLTGRPFAYTRHTPTTATLDAPVPADEPQKEQGVRYEISVVK